ncbi:MAG: hypothetical protein AAB833_00400 [Patescibacteria group bacterium]
MRLCYNQLMTDRGVLGLETLTTPIPSESDSFEVGEIITPDSPITAGEPIGPDHSSATAPLDSATASIGKLDTETIQPPPVIGQPRSSSLDTLTDRHKNLISALCLERYKTLYEQLDPPTKNIFNQAGDRFVAWVLDHPSANPHQLEMEILRWLQTANITDPNWLHLEQVNLATEIIALNTAKTKEQTAVV